MSAPVVAFRTHRWDHHIAQLAHRLCNAVPGVRFVVIADETHGQFSTAPFQKLSHSSDFSAFGLPEFPPGGSLWYNADYPLYLLRQNFPDASHIAMVEYDVTINIPFPQRLRHAMDVQLDLVTHKIVPATPGWEWYAGIRRHYEYPLGAFIPVMIVSARAIDHMLARRREMLALHMPNEVDDWPFCEAFIPTSIYELPDARFEDLNLDAGTQNFTVKFPLHISDERAYRPGSICHPVLGGHAFFDRWIREDATGALFDASSQLRRTLQKFPAAEFMPSLVEFIRNRNSSVAMTKFSQLAEEQGWMR